MTIGWISTARVCFGCGFHEVLQRLQNLLVELCVLLRGSACPSAYLYPRFPLSFSHVLFRPGPRGALHQDPVRPETLGGDDHSVQLQPWLHPAGRRHHHLLRPRARHPRVDVTATPLCLWVPGLSKKKQPTKHELQVAFKERGGVIVPDAGFAWFICPLSL